MPTLDRSPGALAATPNARATYAQHIAAYNAALASRAAAFAAAYSDVTVLTFDANTWFGHVLDDAARFGFTNTTGYCECTDPGYFWYSKCISPSAALYSWPLTYVTADTGHITEHVHRLLADAIRVELERASV